MTCAACGAPAAGDDRFCERCGRPLDGDREERTAPGAAVVTDRGLVHHRNEDAGAVAPGVAVISDGVSMSPDPHIASRTAVHTALVTLTHPPRPADQDSPGDPTPGWTTSRPGDGTRPGEESRPGTADPTPARPATRPGDESRPGDGSQTGDGGRSGVEGRARRGGWEEEDLVDAVTAAAGAVTALGGPRHAPACTLVAATLDAGTLRVAGVGDSRAYWVPDDVPAEQLTEDDSWAAGAVRAGEDPDHAWADPRAHTLTGWLGADTTVRPRVRTVRLDRPGLVVLCSDGLWNYLLDPAELGAAVRAAYAGDLLAAARDLVGLALDRGGRDNITVALLRHGGEEAG